ncbi:MAG: flippase-like domain-containing protein [Chlamydiia bacterium]|nr:flippase-like domain-containing protein [Chlamydiia bacterium]
MNEKPKDFDEPLLKGWRFKLLITIVILTSLGYLLFTLWAGFDGVVDGVKKVGIVGIITTLLIACFAFFMRFLRWQSYLRALHHKIPFFKSLKIFVSGFALTITPGKTGEMVRSVFVKPYNVSYRESLGMFLSERVSDVLAVILIASAGLWHYCEARPIVIFFLFLTASIIIVASQTRWLLWIEEKLTHILPEKIQHYPNFLIEGMIAFRACFQPKVMIPGILLGVLAWGAEGSACYLILKTLGANIPYYTTLFIYAFSLLVGAITFLPGGVGGTEISMAQLFILNGIDSTTAVTATLMIRTLTLWFSVFLGLIVIPKKDPQAS